MIHPKLEAILEEMCSTQKLVSIDTKKFNTYKAQILRCEVALERLPPDITAEQQRAVIDSVMQERPQKNCPEQSHGIIGSAMQAVSKALMIPVNVFKDAMSLPTPSCSNVDFLNRVQGMVEKFPVLAEAGSEAVSVAIKYISEEMKKMTNHVARKIEEMQRAECKRQLKSKREHAWTAVLNASRQDFLQATKDTFMKSSERYSGDNLLDVCILLLTIS